MITLASKTTFLYIEFTIIYEGADEIFTHFFGHPCCVVYPQSLDSAAYGSRDLTLRKLRTPRAGGKQG